MLWKMMLMLLSGQNLTRTTQNKMLKSIKPRLLPLGYGLKLKFPLMEKDKVSRLNYLSIQKTTLKKL